MRRAFWPLVIVFALIGLTARLWNLDFDQRQHLHPDERFWAMTSDGMERAPVPAAHGTAAGPLLDWLDGQRSPANPYVATESFLYGPTPLALTRSAASWLHHGVVDGAQPADAVAHALDAIGVPLIDDAGAPRFDPGYDVDLVGRMLGAFVDTLTIIVIALIGRRLGGRLAGVAAAGLYACSVLAIQHAHFLGSEPYLGLASALTVLAALRLDRSADVSRGAWTGAVAGVAGGAAVAVKLTGATLVAVVAIGCGALLIQHRRRSDVARLAAVVVAAMASFRFFNPSAFNGLGLTLSPSFADDVQRARELRKSTAPPSFQWADRPLIVQPLVWLGTFTVGPGAVLAAAVGAVAMSARLFGTTWMDRRPWSRRLGERVSSLMTDVGRWPLMVIGATTIVPFAYISVASFPTGRYYFPMMPSFYAMAGLGVAATVRLAQRERGRVRTGATAFVAVAVGLAVIWGAGFVHGVYQRTNTRIEASHWIVDHVPAGSVLSSQAWDDGLPLRLPNLDVEQYTGEQLDMVGPDDETKVATVAAQLARIDYVVESSPRLWNTVTRMPQRFPSTINFFDALDTGELGFQRVATFERGISLGPWTLDDTTADEAFSVYDHPEVRIWKKVRDVDRDTIVEVLDPIAAANAVGIDWNRASANGLILTDDEVAANRSGPTYDEAFDTNGSTALHVVLWFMLLELLGVSAFVLFLPVLRRLPDAGFGVAKILALCTLATALFVAAAWVKLPLGRPLVGAVTAAFVTAAGFCAHRRRAELARVWRDRRTALVVVELLGAVVFVGVLVLRALNPDLWHPERGGEKPFEQTLLTAVLRTETLPVYDPWYSHGALNYYYGGWFLISAPARLLRTSPSLIMNLALAVFASCASGAAFTVGAGLVRTPRTRWRRGSRSGRTSVLAGVLAALFVLAISNLAVVRPLWESITGTREPGTPVDWWAMSRVIPGSVSITEFPAWSFLLGDVHPHVMGIAVLLAAGTLCLAWYESLIALRRGHAVVLAVMLGAVIGLIRMTNTWDYPLGAGLAALTLLLALAAHVPWRRLVVPALVLGIVVVVVWSPYIRRGEVFDSGFDPSLLRTPPSSWLKQFGLFAAIAVMVVAIHLDSALRTSRPVWRWITRAHLVVLACSITALAYLAARPGFETFEITTALTIGCAWVAWRRWRHPNADPCRLSPLGPLALALGWAILAVVEMLTVRNDGGRQNTVFKFWYESWIVLAVGSAAVVAEQLLTRGRGPRTASRALVSCAVVMGVAFWWMTTPVRTDDRLSAGGLSLDGEAYLTDEFVYGGGEDRFVPADDVPLVDWLRANVHGIRVVAEAPPSDYKWTGRTGWLTGLASPLGWPYHESQQRRPYGPSLESRRDDMNELFTTTDTGVMADVLARRSVDYVLFGTQEQLISTRTSAAVLRSFECLTIEAEADRSTEGGVVADDLFVATVDRECVNRLRPPLPAPPPPPA